MLEKKQKIINYIHSTTKQINKEYPNIFDEDKIKYIIDMFQDSKEEYEDIIKKINELIKKAIQDYLLKKELMKKMEKRTYNYNIHTYRSGKEKYTSDSDIIKNAKEKGITNVGFCDRIPNPKLILPDEDNRMLLCEVDEYLASINKLKQDNPDITILKGFEAEYDPMKESFLGEMREKVDYMVLGQNYFSSEMKHVTALGNPNYPLEYANMLSKAMESGLFDIVNHPDYFMKFRDTMTNDQAKDIFDKNCITASKIICQKAKEMGIPLQIEPNVYALSDGKLSYPHPLFWKIASCTNGLKILKGYDEKSFENVEQIKSIISMINDKIISGNYNPKTARQNNKLLQEKYNASQAKSLTFNAQIFSQIVEGINSKIPDDLDSYSTMLYIQKGFDDTMKSFINIANQKDKNTIKQLSKLVENDNITNAEKKAKINRKKMAIEETNRVLAYQQKSVENAKNAVKSSVNMGCNNKKEIKNVSTQIVEYNTTKNPIKKNQAGSKISSFTQNTKTVQSKPPVLKLSRPTNTTSTKSSNKGSTNAIMISLFVVFMIGIIIGICSMIIK